MTPWFTFAAAVAVAAALVWLAVADARRFDIPPAAVALLVAAAAAWHVADAGAQALLAPALTALAAAGATFAVIGAAALGRRRWPLMPGDAMLFGGLGFLLGPLGGAWALLAGSALALSHRGCVQRRRGRPLTRGYCPVAPGFALAAGVVFACQAAGGIARADGTGIVWEPAAAAPIEATELAPVAPPGPPGADAMPVTLEQRTPIALGDLAARIASVAGYDTAIEERPARTPDGAVALAEAEPLGVAWDGPLAGLLDHVARETGYRWAWRAGRDHEIVFYRYWDAEWAALLVPIRPFRTPGTSTSRATARCGRSWRSGPATRAGPWPGWPATTTRLRPTPLSRAASLRRSTGCWPIRRRGAR